jgi:hypothetical protein
MENSKNMVVKVQAGTGKLICPRHGEVADAEYREQIPSPCSKNDEAWVWEDGELIAVPLFILKEGGKK